MSVSLSKIPGLYIAGFFGPFGSGKTLAMLEYGLQLANSLRLSLVFNFEVDPIFIRKYCRFRGFWWVSSCARISIKEYISDFFQSEDSVLFFDEAGSQLFSRHWMDASRSEVLDRIFRIRHYGNRLLFSAQDKAQVDKQLRDRCQILAWCRGFVVSGRILSRNLFFFDPVSFEKFDENYQNKWIYPFWASKFRFDWRLVSENEKLLFRCYNSFDRPYSRSRSKSVLRRMRCFNFDIDYSPLIHPESMFHSPDEVFSSNRVSQSQPSSFF